MKTSDFEIALAVREGVRRALQLPGDWGISRVDRRQGPGMRRGGRSAGGGQSDSVDPNGAGTMYGLTNFSSLNRLESAGGEAGTATGFGVVWLGKLDKVVAAYRVLLRRYNGANGYALDMLANNGALAFAVLADDGTLKQAQRFFTQSDAGRIFLFTCMVQNGAVQLYVGRDLVASTPIVGYRVATATSTGVGADVTGVTPASDSAFLAEMTFRGTPTAANVAAFADSVRVLGDLPLTFPGATVTHRHSVRDELAGAPNPAGKKTLGARNFTAANYFSTPNGSPGVATGFSVAVEVRFDSIPSGANARMFSKSNNFSLGWRVYCINGAWQLNAFGNAGSADEKNSPAYTVTAADVGRKRRALFVHDGAKLRTYVEGYGQIGDGTVITGFSPAAVPQYFGRDFGGVDASAMTLFAGATGHVVLSSAQALAYLAQCEAADALLPFAGAEHFYSLPLDIGSGTTVPTLLTDRIGVDHMARAGFDVRTGPNGIQGVGPYSATEAWRSAPGAGLQGSATFHGVLDLVYSKVPTAAEIPVACTNAGTTTGWFLRATAAAALSITVTNGQSAAYTITNTDLNKRTRIFWQLTGGLLVFYVNGVQVGSAVASAYAANAADIALQLGQFFGGQPLGSAVIETFQGGNAVLTPAEIVALHADLTVLPPVVVGKTSKRWVFGQDIAAALGVMPAKSVERISGNDDLTRVGVGLELAVDVTKGPATPVQLTDTTTKVVSDALATKGKPEVVIVDPSIDGRRSLGAQGFATTNFLQTAAAQGIPGTANGLTVLLGWRFDNVAIAGAKTLASYTNAATTRGWIVQQDTATNVRLVLWNASGATSIVNLPISTSDNGQRVAIAGTYNGSSMTFLIMRETLSVATVVTVAAALEPAVDGLRVGLLHNNTQAMDSGSWFELAGGNVGLSLAEVTAELEAWKTTGSFANTSGKLQHAYKPTLDILASGVEAVPGQVLDRIGTDHLTRIGGNTIAQFRAGVRALANLDQYLFPTASPGVLGSAAGFHLVVAAKIDTQGGVSITRELVSRVAGTAGYELRTVQQSANLQFIVYGTGGTLYIATMAITPAMVGVELLIVANSTGTTLSLYALNVSTVATGAVTGFTAPAATTAMGIGGHSNGLNFPVSGYQLAGMSGGNASLTAPEITQLFVDFAATGRVPRVAGKATHWYDFELDFQESGGVLPNMFKERIGGVEHAARLGSPLTLAQRAERTWSYETSPIMYGAQVASASDFWSRTDGFAGDSAGFMVELLYMPLALTAGTRIIAGKRGTMGGADPSLFRGWHIATTGVNSLLSFACGGTTNAGSPNTTISTSDIGKLFLFTGVWDASTGKVRAFCRRMETGAGTALTGGFLPNTSDAFTLGKRSDGFPATDMKILGFRAGNFIPTLSEVQAATDAVMANERMQRSDYQKPLACMYRFPTGVLPATLNDLIGNAHLTLAGAPTMVDQTARAWAA